MIWKTREKTTLEDKNPTILETNPTFLEEEFTKSDRNSKENSIKHAFNANMIRPVQILDSDFCLYTIWRIHPSFVLPCVAKISYFQLHIYMTEILQSGTSNSTTV